MFPKQSWNITRESHEVNKRPNKHRKNQEPYITEKLPRGRQAYINEVELFFSPRAAYLVESCIG